LHLRTQAPAKNRQALLTAILADGINLGLSRMSEACRETTWRQLSWTADWHVREECYAQALAGLTMLSIASPSRLTGAAAPLHPRTLSSFTPAFVAKSEVW
jgi:Tn3 transposase DDE domain